METKNTLQSLIPVITIFIISNILFTYLPAQEITDIPTIGIEEKQQVVDSIALFMTDKYVFPDKGKEMGDLVSKNFKDGKYNDISNPIEFADQLTKDLLTINNDRHIGVRYMP